MVLHIFWEVTVGFYRCFLKAFLMSVINSTETGRGFLQGIELLEHYIDGPSKL